MLQLDELVFLAEVVSLGQLEQRDKALGPGRAGLDAFDLEGGSGLPGADHRAEAAVARQIVVDPLPANLPGRGDRVVVVRLQQIDLVALLDVVQRKRLTGQQLVEEPQTPGVLAGGPGADVLGPVQPENRYSRHNTITFLRYQGKTVTQRLCAWWDTYNVSAARCRLGAGPWEGKPKP